MSNSELFPAYSVSETEIQAILDQEAEGSRGYEQETGGDLACYVEDRRSILGPAADITHPEFGRPNRPEETFRLVYELSEEPTGVVLEDGKKARKVYEWVIREYILSHDDQLMACTNQGTY